MARLRALPDYWRNALAIGAATFVYGLSFGVLAVGAGLSVAQTCAMSLLVFSGASQFAVVGVVANGGATGPAIANALLLGARNTAYGFVVAPLLPGGRARRALLAQVVVDESVAMSRAQDDPVEARRAFLSTGAAIYVLWNLGTLAGALAGDVIGDPKDLGLDAMFPAAFLALLAPQLRQPGAWRAAVAGALIALALVPLVPAGIPVLAASLGVLAAGRTALTAGEPSPDPAAQTDRAP
ncbi:MAG TPA: AzlC family ABC transporter permease [Thermoleophilaceae bacterium]|jgi:4-azaleucine resistance transporter AzlC